MSVASLALGDVSTLYAPSRAPAASTSKTSTFRPRDPVLQVICRPYW